MPAACRSCSDLGERGLLHKDALTVNGKSIWDNVKDAPCWNREVITTFEEPFKPEAGIAILQRQSRPERRGHQAIGCIAGVDAAYGPRGRVRDHRGPASPYR